MINSREGMDLEWRVVPGFSDYKISECGDLVRIVKSKTRSIGHKPKKIRMTSSQSGYFRYKITNDKHQKISIGAHILVALAFHGQKPTKKHMALHWDDNGLNNHYSNIRWGTQIDNAQDVQRNGQLKGEHNPKAKLTEKQVISLRIRYNKGGITIKQIAAEVGLSLTATASMLNGKNWKHLPFAYSIKKRSRL